MSGELQLDYGQTGKAVYALVYNSVGFVWNGATFETPVAANWTTYAITLTEQSTTGFYRGDFPAIGAGVYGAAVRLKAGGSVATTDYVIGASLVNWDGAVEIGLSALPLNIWSTIVPGVFAGGTAGASVGKIGTATVIVSSPISQAGTINITQGDDYLLVDARQIDVTDAGGTWPNLTEANSVSFVCAVLNKTMTTVVAGGSSQKIRLQFTASDTLSINVVNIQNYSYVIRAVLSNGDVVTLVNGLIFIAAKIK